MIFCFFLQFSRSLILDSKTNHQISLLNYQDKFYILTSIFFCFYMEFDDGGAISISSSSSNNKFQCEYSVFGWCRVLKGSGGALFIKTPNIFFSRNFGYHCEAVSYETEVYETNLPPSSCIPNAATNGYGSFCCTQNSDAGNFDFQSISLFKCPPGDPERLSNFNDCLYMTQASSMYFDSRAITNINIQFFK